MARVVETFKTHALEREKESAIIIKIDRERWGRGSNLLGTSRVTTNFCNKTFY